MFCILIISSNIWNRKIYISSQQKDPHPSIQRASVGSKHRYSMKRRRESACGAHQPESIAASLAPRLSSLSMCIGKKSFDARQYENTGRDLLPLPLQCRPGLSGKDHDSDGPYIPYDVSRQADERFLHATAWPFPRKFASA